MSRELLRIYARRRRAQRRAMLDRLVGYVLLALSIVIPAALAAFLRIGW